MDIIMPQLGETVSEGTLTVWHKKEGDTVTADEVLFEIGTDKVEMEIPAPASGILLEIRVEEGATVDVGTVLAVIDDGKGSAIAAPAKEKSALAKEAAGPKKSAPVKPGLDKSLKLSPVVRKLLAENGLEPSQIAGTGRDGRITRGDVLAHLKGKPKPASTPKSEDGRTVIPFDYRRKAIAEHMMRSKATSAHVLQALEADFSGIDKARKPVAAEWKRREGFSLTYLPFIAKAVCAAMRDFPNINGTVEGENLVVDAQVNLAFAIDLDFQGLIAPVVHDAHLKSVPEIARAVRDLSVRARADNLTPDDMMGATYTITNNGSFGTLITAPIINQPQVAILSTDGVQKKPVVVEVDGEDLIAIRPIGVLAQSFDHRVIDGAYSASFLAKVKEIIETRDWSAAL